jgi:preprotein translocase subunit SecG
VAVTISLALLFGIVLVLLLKSKAVGAGSAFIAAGFGFFLASTGAAGPINQITADLLTAVSNL